MAICAGASQISLDEPVGQTLRNGDYTYYDDTVDPANFEKTMFFSTIQSLVKTLSLESFVKLLLVPSSLWAQQVIAAYSVVTKDIPAYTVYGVNPAKKIKN